MQETLKQGNFSGNLRAYYLSVFVHLGELQSKIKSLAFEQLALSHEIHR